MIEPSHAEWQQQVLDLAHSLGWAHLHVRRSIGKGRQWVTTTNVIGWPDLLLWHPTRAGVIAVELKVGRDKLSADQEAALASLAAAGIDSYTWRPADLDAAIAILRDPPNRSKLRGLPA